MRASALTTDKFQCPTCGGWKSNVIDSRPDTQGVTYLRWRHCAGCHQLFETAEQATGKTMPLRPEPTPAPSGSTS
jgi:hypothetical protein